ncbi:MAG: bacteriohemerythrin [Parcubacteria group bacterium]|jgi:hemerythrin
MEIRFLWTEDMTVHNDILDMQHKQLFGKINELLEAIVNETTENVVDDMVQFFKDYMDQHFHYEERYLTENGYPDVLAHKQKHAVFVDKYYELKKKLGDGVDTNTLVLEIENFMGSWLTQHILVEDHLYARYFQEKNIQ